MNVFVQMAYTSIKSCLIRDWRSLCIKGPARNNWQNSERLAHHSDSCKFMHESLFFCSLEESGGTGIDSRWIGIFDIDY